MRPLLAALLSILLVAAGCDRPPRAYGDPSSIIVLAQDALWEQIRDTVIASLEPRILTVRQERMFRVTQIDPTNPDWGTLRQFRQVLLFGRPDDPWIREAADEAGRDTLSPPEVFDARNVWVNEQIVTVAVLPPESPVAAVRRLAPRIQERFDTRFRQLARQRMYVSGVDQELADSLSRIAGFSLMVPQIYAPERASDSVFVFRDLGHGEADLQRTFLVGWRRGAQRPLGIEDALAWRDTLLARHFGEDVLTLRDGLRVDTVTTPVGQAIQIQGSWERPRREGAWPGGGPFITRVTRCPSQDRTYLLDATLYAPGREKYEYMLQLWTILDTFRCADAQRNVEAGGGKAAGGRRS
ncbi:MAG: DUF4837 family protein [Longimicrobiales bacterium]